MLILILFSQYHRASSIYINNDYTDVIMPKNMTPNSKHGADKKTQKTQNDQTLFFHNIRYKSQICINPFEQSNDHRPIVHKIQFCRSLKIK